MNYDVVGAYYYDIENQIDIISKSHNSESKYYFVKKDRNIIVKEGRVGFWRRLLPKYHSKYQTILSKRFEEQIIGFLQGSIATREQIQPIADKIIWQLPNSTAFHHLYEVAKRTISTRELENPFLPMVRLKEQSDAFTARLIRGDPITLYDSKPFLEYLLYFQFNLSQQDRISPQDKESLRSMLEIENRLKDYFRDTHQIGGFEELRVSTYQKVFLDLCSHRPDDVARVIQAEKTRPVTESSAFTPFKNLCKKITDDIDHKTDEQPSIHGHPRDLFTVADVRSLTQVVGWQNDRHAAGWLEFIQRKCANADAEIQMKYATLLRRLESVDIAVLAAKPASELSADELALIVRAKDAYMEIDQGPGRSLSWDLMTEASYFPSTTAHGLRKLAALNEMRGEEIDRATMQHWIREHKEVQNHPRVAIEGAGPTGLLLAITQFRAGADVSLYEKRSMQYERTQIVRLDPKWMTMLQHYLGEEYHRLFSDPGRKGILREDGFGEIATLYLEEALHLRLTNLMSMLDPDDSQSLERMAAYELSRVYSPATEGEKFEIQAHYNPSADVVSPSTKAETELIQRREVDMVICAGGKSSPIKDTFLPSSTAVTTEEHYAVCSWLATSIPGQTNQMNLFQDFRNMVHLNDEFREAYCASLIADLNPEGVIGYSIDEGLANALVDIINELPAMQTFVNAGPEQPYIQTRTFENQGLIYVGMEVPREVATLLKDFEDAIEAKMRELDCYNLRDKRMIMDSAKRLWYQAIMNSYGLDKTSQLTLGRIDSKFSAMFPVSQYRMDPDQSLSRVRKGESELVVVAAGDAFASPHFMRYSGLTGARENILDYQHYTHEMTHRRHAKRHQTALLTELSRKGDRTARFVIGRGYAFLQPRPVEEVAQARKEQIIGIMQREVMKTGQGDHSYRVTPTDYPDTFHLEIQEGEAIHTLFLTAKAGWLEVRREGQIEAETYQSFEQLRLTLGLDRRPTTTFPPSMA